MSAAAELAAYALLARRSGGPAAALPLLSEADAYLVQARVLDLLGEDVAGWKIAIVDGRPVAAPFPTAALVPSGVALARTGGLKVETELGFRLAGDLPYRAAPYSRDDILRAIQSMYACFEIVGPRIAEPPASSFAAFLADNLGCAHVVVAEGVPPGALPAEGALAIDDVWIAAGPHPHGDPLAALLAWANGQCDAAGGLRRGQIIITGTFTGALAIGSASRLEGRFAGLPPVAATFVEAGAQSYREQVSCR